MSCLAGALAINRSALRLGYGFFLGALLLTLVATVYPALRSRIFSPLTI